MSAKILVVDDEPDIRFLLREILEDEGYDVDVAEHAKAANEIRNTRTPDLVLLDIWMPDIDGVTLLKEWKSSGEDQCPVVMMSGHGTVETAVEATKFGAYDFVEKPLSMAKLLSTVKAALTSSGRASDQDIQQKIEIPIGNSQIIKQLKEKIQFLHESDEVVFFTGASGSGRNLWAYYLCDMADKSARMRVMQPTQHLKDLLPLKQDLYIPEVVELSPADQVLLNDTLKQKSLISNFRLIVASEFDFEYLVASGKCLSELAEYWRQAIYIPSLNEHIEDIPELLEYYVNWFGEYDELPYRHFGVAAQNLLRNHHWSGGIRQLKDFIKAALANSEDETIELDEVQFLLHKSSQVNLSNTENTMQVTVDLNLELREAREMFEREFLSRHLELCGNNITELAKRVGQERTHLYRKLKSLGLHNKKQS